MKKLIILIFLLPLLTWGQAKSVVYKDVYFYADSISQVLDISSIGRGVFLYGLMVNNTFNVDTVSYLVGDGANWYELQASGVQVTTAMDSTKALAVMLPEANFRLWKQFKFLIPADIADTNYFKAVLKLE